MKKRLALVLMFGVTLGISGCSSGVSRAEYEKVVQERNEYKAQLDALTGETGLDFSLSIITSTSFIISNSSVWERDVIFCSLLSSFPEIKNSTETPK